ncbi:DUF4424 family protein [Ideonella sp. DXS29W]|uniref:DUF4424 family protein n=1 Tax=Ideonella lacteola TaxID=2984193 RepID=A0ABU9BX59_9BURK
MKITRAIVLAVALSGSAASHANDTAIGDDNGTITFKQLPHVSMDSEALFISEALVTVDYVFTNNGPADVVTPVAFPMPPAYFGDSDHTEIENFKVWADGRLVNAEQKWVIRRGEVDVSDQVRRWGWTTDDIFRLMQGGGTPKGKKPLPSHWFDTNGEPLITISKYHVWQQTFPAGKPLTIRHSYVPSVTTGVPQSWSTLFEAYGKETCPDKALIAGIEKRDGEGGWEYNFLSYILTTANHWQGPIKDFKLTIRKRQPTDVFSLCFDGAFKKTDPLTFEFRQSDFRPTRDLKILFLRRRKPE